MDISFPRILRVTLLLIVTVTATASSVLATDDYFAPRPWSLRRANAWHERTGWLVGANYTPAYAVNQLEMWQASTFDAVAIDTELGYAESLGFNSLRVYLHHLLWQQDSEGLLARMEQFLGIADSHGIGVMFVLLDGVWDPLPQPGPQPAPIPHVHNSRWLQSPGAEILGDPDRYVEIKRYVKGVIRHFRRDQRIHAWDLFNEPDNDNAISYAATELLDKEERAAQLLAKVFRWSRRARPKQPRTAAVWTGFWWAGPSHQRPIDKLMLEHSDVVSFHHYGPLEGYERRWNAIRLYGRPILCTEYMARSFQSTFDPVLGYLADRNVSAYSWGLVSGKTQTIYSWASWWLVITQPPTVWFHDILNPDGSAHDQAEVDYIRSLTLP